MKRRILATATAIASAVLTITALDATPTSASGAPIRGTFDFASSFVDTEVCAAEPWGFDVYVPLDHEYGFYEVFLDQDGNFVRAIVHINHEAIITANGKTIVQRETWTSFFYPDGSRDVGLWGHIQGRGGMVVRDAGQIVRDADGSVLYTRGPHEQLSGVSFCPPLVP
jgi:hypothetical protein